MEIKALPNIIVNGTDANDTNYISNPYPYTVRVRKLAFMPKTSVATHASNYITTTITNAGGDTLTTHGTDSATGSALTAGTEKELTLSGTGKQLEIAAGAKMTVAVVKSGTGPAFNNQVIAVVDPLRAS